MPEEKDSVVAMVESIGETSSEILALELLPFLVKKCKSKTREGTKRSIQIIKWMEIYLTRTDWYNSFNLAK